MENPFEKAKIVLDEPRSIYYAGQILIGRIEWNLPQPLQLTTVTVTFYGEATTEWTETDIEQYGNEKRKKITTYKGKEEYFNFTQCIFGGPHVSQLPAGTHTLPFQYRIPETVPSSYTGQCGQIVYSVTARVDIPGGRFETLIKHFEVVAPMQMDNEEGRAPVELELEKFFSCCCKFSHMTIVVRLPVSAYCPGQRIPISISANNSSSIEIKSIVFRLVKRCGFRTRQPASEYTPPEEVLQTVRTGAILGNTRRELSYELLVPDMIAPNLDNSDIIDMGFAVKVKAKLSGCNEDIEDEFDIILGLTPLPGTPGFEGYKHPMADNLPRAAIPPANPVPSVYPNVPTSQMNPDSTGYPNAAPPYPGALYPDTRAGQGIGFVVPGGSPPAYPGVDKPNAQSYTHAPVIHYPASAPSAPPC